MISTFFGTRFLKDHAWMIMRVTITALDSKQPWGYQNGFRKILSTPLKTNIHPLENSGEFSGV